MSSQTGQYQCSAFELEIVSRGIAPLFNSQRWSVARVFVSHASEDHVVAAELHQWLVDDGHDVFLDQDLRDGIALGEDWEPGC